MDGLNQSSPGGMAQYGQGSGDLSGTQCVGQGWPEHDKLAKQLGVGSGGNSPSQAVNSTPDPFSKVKWFPAYAPRSVNAPNVTTSYCYDAAEVDQALAEVREQHARKVREMQRAIDRLTSAFNDVRSQNIKNVALALLRSGIIRDLEQQIVNGGPT